MNRLGTLATAFVATAIVAGCSPTLTGAACLTDCNCPGAQRCARNPDGGHGLCIDGANYCGKDAGPALLGTLTLNGGIAKPPNNAANVYAWDHQPIIFDDGGFESALLTAAVNSDGTWGMEDATSAGTYWLVGQYVMSPLKQGFSVPVQVTANGNLVTVDVPTLTCAVSTLRTAPGATATILWAGALVDLPDINTGLEVGDAGVKVSDGTTDISMPLTTVQLLIPYVTAERYAYAPPASSPATAAQTYTFRIKAAGYSGGALCTVTPHPLEHVPSLTTVINPWPLDAGVTVGVAPPTESNVSVFGINDSAMTPLMLPMGINPKIYPTGTTSLQLFFDVGTTVTASSCPMPAQCTFNVVSARFTREGPGTSEDTSYSSTPFSTP
jgi:hypothetical protein